MREEKKEFLWRRLLHGFEITNNILSMRQCILFFFEVFFTDVINTNLNIYNKHVIFGILITLTMLLLIHTCTDFRGRLSQYNKISDRFHHKLELKHFSAP